MSILADKNTRIIVQGITGTQASFHVKRSIEGGTNIVGGVTPGKGGSFHLGVPVFNTVKEAVAATGATTTVIFVPAAAAKAAIIEAAEAELELAVCVTRNIPTRDMLEVRNILKNHKTKLIGPNTPGLITPGEARLGFFPEDIHRPGHIGIVSRSSTLTYEAVLESNRAGMGQSTVIGLGDDIVIGMDFVEALQEFINDEKTKAIIIIGQIDGTFEEKCAQWYQQQRRKPVICFLAGNSFSGNEKIGYAGDIITHGRITPESKNRYLADAGFIMVEQINQIHIELQKLNL